MNMPMVLVLAAAAVVAAVAEGGEVFSSRDGLWHGQTAGTLSSGVWCRSALLLSVIDIIRAKASCCASKPAS